MERIIERPRFSPSKEIEYYYSHNNNIFENIIETNLENNNSNNNSNDNSNNIMMNYNKEHNKIVLLLSPNFAISFSIIITCSFAYFIKYILLLFP